MILKSVKAVIDYFPVLMAFQTLYRFISIDLNISHGDHCSRDIDTDSNLNRFAVYWALRSEQSTDPA